MNKIIKNFENFEIHHKILLFLGIVIATILISRGIVYYILDPNLNILGFELHHFDYGLFILIMTVLFMLFVGKYWKTYLIFSAISIGLIIDELWFIRMQIGGNNPAIYNPSLPYVLSLAILVGLIAFLISHFLKRKYKK